MRAAEIVAKPSKVETPTIRKGRVWSHLFLGVTRRREANVILDRISHKIGGSIHFTRGAEDIIRAILGLRDAFSAGVQNT